jgi:rubrerythrin
MDNINKEVIGIVREAIKLEINGRGFFNYAAEATDNKLGKKMFTKLANDEIEHLKVFSELFSSYLGSDDWKKFVNQEEKNSSEIIEQLKSRVNSQKEKKSGELEAIRIGMELERKAIDFFESSANSTQDEKTKDICNRIANEEKLHYDLLQLQLDSVTNSGFWFDVADYKMDGQY